MVSSYGAEKFCRSIRSTGLSVLEFGRDPERGLAALAHQGELAVREDGGRVASCWGALALWISWKI